MNVYKRVAKTQFIEYDSTSTFAIKYILLENSFYIKYFDINLEQE